METTKEALTNFSHRIKKRVVSLSGLMRTRPVCLSYTVGVYTFGGVADVLLRARENFFPDRGLTLLESEDSLQTCGSLFLLAASIEAWLKDAETLLPQEIDDPFQLPLEAYALTATRVGILFPPIQCAQDLVIARYETHGETYLEAGKTHLISTICDKIDRFRHVVNSMQGDARKMREPWVQHGLHDPSIDIVGYCILLLDCCLYRGENVGNGF